MMKLEKSPRTKLKIYTFLLLIFGFYAFNYSGVKPDREQKSIDLLKKEFGDHIIIDTYTIPLTEPDIVKIKERIRYLPNFRQTLIFVCKKDNVTIGYGLVDDVMGKSKPITYLTIIDNDEIVKNVEILAYREPYGGEVGYDVFRKQYIGKSYENKLRIGADIKNISGATISARAVTEGVKKMLTVFHVIRDRVDHGIQ